MCSSPLHGALARFHQHLPGVFLLERLGRAIEALVTATERGTSQNLRPKGPSEGHHYKEQRQRENHDTRDQGHVHVGRGFFHAPWVGTAAWDEIWVGTAAWDEEAAAA